MPKDIFVKHIAIPQDHGSWVFLFSPLLIGLFAGAAWHPESFVLVLAALCAFLARNPVTVLVKVYSGRRSRRDLPAALFWSAAYAILGILLLGYLVLRGYGFLLWLGIPAVPVFAWHLYLVSRRAERRKPGLEIVATGTLALGAPAAYWVGLGTPDPNGWWLWLLTWLQAAASIAYAYLRLEQRVWKTLPPSAERWKAGGRALLYTTFNLAVTAALGFAGILPRWLFLAYLVQWAEALWGITHPAIKTKPTVIGFRQLLVSTLYTIVFILTWRMG